MFRSKTSRQMQAKSVQAYSTDLSVLPQYPSGKNGFIADKRALESDMLVFATDFRHVANRVYKEAVLYGQ